MVQKLADYIEMTKMNYNEVVQKLLDKYGPATDDYFREISYQRFLNGENKTITKGKISRASEGLYCHHIDENKFDNLSNAKFVAYYRYDFSYQRSDRLVYCNLIKHMILHFLIAIETKGGHGSLGFEVIRGIVYDSYVQEIHDFKSEWRNTAYEEAYLPSSEARQLLDYLDEQLLVDAPESVLRRQEYERELEEAMQLQQARHRAEEERLQKQEEEKEQAFEKSYPVAVSLGFDHKSTRRAVSLKLYELEYPNKEIPFKKFDNDNKVFLKEELFDRLEEFEKK